MKMFLKKCLFFLGIIVVLNAIYLFLLVSFSPGFKKVHDISTFKNKEYDLIIVGNSMALDGVDANYISERGIKTYNLAVAGNHVSTTLQMMEHYLENNKPPKMVVIGLSSAVGKSYLNPVAYHNPEVDFFYKPDLWENIKNPPMLKFQWLAVDMVKILISKEHRNARMENGQWRTEKIIPDNSSFNSKKDEPNYYDNVYLQKLVVLCEKQNIKIVMVEMTGSKSSQNSIPFVKDYAVFKDRKLTIYNLNNHEIATSIIDSNTDWLAPDHLNVFGAKKETQFLFEEIIQSNYTK